MTRIASTWALAAGLALPLTLANAAHAADDAAFCGDLKSVLAESGNGFDTLRGTLLSTDYWQSPAHPVTAYTSLRPISGAVSCMVEDDSSNATYPKIYSCAFAPTSSKIEAMTAVGLSIGDCIGVQNDDELDADDSTDTGNIDFDRPHYKISLVASDSQTNIRFVIFPK